MQETHTNTQGPIVPRVLPTSNPGDTTGTGGVKQKGPKNVCVTGAGLFSVIWNTWLFWTPGRSVGACAHILHRDDPHTLCPSSVSNRNIWFTGDFQETNICLCKGWIMLLMRTGLASLKPDLCLHYQQTLLAMETYRRKHSSSNWPIISCQFFGRCMSPRAGQDGENQMSWYFLPNTSLDIATILYG